ncbi:MAG TPA: hypothetical protein VLB80_03115 [Candidatus Babeliales bacterium]|nr:hypothetical protein [Candidatus Babeliales bacterium]
MLTINEIIFALNNHEKIIIQLKSPLSTSDYCSTTPIILMQNNKQLILTKDFLYHNMNRLITLLKKALKNELLSDHYIMHDIGFLFNQYSANLCGEKLKKPTGLIYKKKNNISYWPGNDYHLWAHNYISWIYNKSDRSIIFEVTPFYPYMYCEPEEESNYIPYNEWIKTYKPYLIREIPRAIAQEWLKQAEYIIQTIIFKFID